MKIEEIRTAINHLNEAEEKLDELVSEMRAVRNLVRGHDDAIGYCMSGNMDAYVINHLTGGAGGSMAGSISDYIAELREMLAEAEEA